MEIWKEFDQNVISHSAAHHLMRPFVGGAGVILTLHHVRPPRFDRFQPNRLLEITPSFLDDVVRWLRRSRATTRRSQASTARLRSHREISMRPSSARTRCCI